MQDQELYQGNQPNRKRGSTNYTPNVYLLVLSVAKVIYIIDSQNDKVISKASLYSTLRI